MEIVKTGPRAVRLLVARESSTQDMPMLENMIAQTVNNYPDIPRTEVDAILAAGVQPLDHSHFPERELFHEGGTTAALFRAGDTWVLISKGSATKIDTKKENGFTSILCRVLETLRPRELLLATFSRMIRSATLSGTVLAACEEHVDTVKCREQTMAMRSGEGRVMWQFLAMLASSERDSQMTRLTLGRLAKHRRGRWCWSPAALPLGWKLEDGVPRLDPAAEPVVRQMLELLADPSMNAPKILKALGRLGVRSPRQGSSGGWEIDDVGEEDNVDADRGLQSSEEDRDAESNPVGMDDHVEPNGPLPPDDGPASEPVPLRIDDLSNVAGRVRRFYDLLPIYQTGEYLTRWEVPVSASKLAEYEVVPTDEEHKAHVPVLYELPLPVGGFASSEVFIAAQRKVESNKERYGAADRSLRRLPLLAGSARRFEHDGSTYQLRSYTDSQGAPAYAIYSVDGGSVVAVLNAGELASAISQAAIAAVRDGVTFAHLDVIDDLRSVLTKRAGSAPSVHVRIRSLEQHAQSLQVKVSLAIRNSMNPKIASMQQLIDRFLSDAAVAQSQEDAVREQINALRREAESEDVAVREFSLDGDLVAALIAGLAQETKPVPRDVASAITDLIADLRFDLHAVDLGVAFRLRLPAAGGWVASEELCTTVRNRARGDGAVQAQRRSSAAAMWMTTEALMSELPGRKGGDNGRSFRDKLVEELRDQGLEGDSPWLMTLHPLLVARHTVWTRLHGEPTPSDVDDDFANLLAETYLDTPSTSRRWLQACSEQHAQVLSLLHGAGTRVPRPEFRAIAEEAGLSTRVIHGMARAGVIRLPAGKRYCGVSPCGDADCARHGLVTPTPCPHCIAPAWADHPLAVPEVPSSLLCRTCRKAPVANSPVYPEAYLQMDAASYAVWLAAAVPDVAETRASRKGQGATQMLRKAAERIGQPVPAKGRLSQKTRLELEEAVQRAE